MWAVIIVEFFILAIVCVYVLHLFVAFKRTPWYALVSTWLGWLLCFSIVFLVPIDIIDTDHEDCITAHNTTESPESYCPEPITYLPGTVMVVQWKVLWWGTMILSWLAFPFLGSYFGAGDFSVWEKVVRSIKENVILYLVLGVIGIIGLIVVYASSGLSKDAFFDFMLALANAYGLVLTICLMGYGLVDIPRYMFRKSNRTATLRYYSVMAFKYKEGIEHAKADLLKTLKLVKVLSDKVRDHDPFRPYVDVILAKCPLEYGDISGEGDVEISYAKLVAIHQRVASDTHNVTRAVCLYENMLKKAFKTEDIMRTKTHAQSDLKIYWSFIPARTHRFTKIVDAIEYVWQVYLFTTTFRILSVLSGLLSIMIVWCELTLTTTADLSPFSHLIKSVPLTGTPKQILCLVVIFYMALCAYTTLFKLKVFNFYRLVPHQMSDGNSIMFSANYLCRLAAPLSYNFLTLINADDRSFTEVMGDMNAVPILGRDFVIFFPVLVSVLCLAAIFNLYSKIGAMCCIKRLRYRPENDENLAEEGEKILQDERENKEGKGSVQLTTKQTIRSTIREEVSKVTDKLERDERERDAKQAAQEVPIPTPQVVQPPTTLSGQMAAKYGRSNPDDLLPSTSRFAKKGTTAPSEPSASNIRHNLSNNSLNTAAAAPATTSTTGMRKNLSSNTLSTVDTNNPSSNFPSFSRFLTPAAPPSSLPAPPPLSVPASTSTSTISHTRTKTPHDLLPATSRFAQRAPPAPAPAPSAAILVSAPPDSGTRSDTKSLVGGLFGKKSQFSLLDRGNVNSS